MPREPVLDGFIMKNSAMVMTIQDPASQRLTWNKPPLTVLVIKKVHDISVIQPFIDLVKWLVYEKHMLVFVEASVLDENYLLLNPSYPSIKDKLCTFKEGRDDLTDKIDFIVCMGGDGTLLYASSLFQQSVPPVMAFHLGSLGFLTPFEFDNFEEQVTNVLEGHAALTLRSRLRCIIVRKNDAGEKNNEPHTSFLVLNEVVVDRGPSPYLSNIDLYLDGKHVTTVQGDALQSLQRHCKESEHDIQTFLGYTIAPQQNLTSLVGLLKQLSSIRNLKSEPNFVADRVNADRQHRVRRGRRGVDDPPERAGHHGDAHLPALSLLPPHRGACGGGAQDHGVARVPQPRLGVVRRPQETGAQARRQPAGDHVHLPDPVDLRAGPDQRLVRQPGRVPALERAQEAEAAGRVLGPRALLLHPAARGPCLLVQKSPVGFLQHFQDARVIAHMCKDGCSGLEPFVFLLWKNNYKEDSVVNRDGRSPDHFLPQFRSEGRTALRVKTNDFLILS
ncbi:hypothetical protein CEXT_274731 [Caerostris extrusa]|uniref:NAD(+) kinase n=1 Tax=Caerostris extrusa TaxID=172846 RepID=A0AAV4N3I5_CAEEX|nr:hypothetical protein CEXT_274731 [Caerostris extrusa]